VTIPTPEAYSSKTRRIVAACSSLIWRTTRSRVPLFSGERDRPRGRVRSVDRGTCRPGIQPRKSLTPGRRRRGGRRKATSGASISRDARESRAVRDPGHVSTHLAREPGEPLSARGRWTRGPRREVYGRTPAMNGPGRSDRPVVPAKFPNKAGRPAAEGMEGRGLAKGNPSQQNALRAQHRDGARSALERVREVAERDKGGGSRRSCTTSIPSSTCGRRTTR